ncbi:MAG: hypothetical protein K2X55_30365 [Burkholderiaceae bacterium]|nr:hypothetical protein [Burkholderiaceae bacterium]
MQSAWFAQGKAAGHDGLIISNYEDGGTGMADTYQSAGRHTVYVAFKPEQVKSAVGNNGQYSVSNRDIAFSRTGLADTLATAANRVQDLRLPAGYRMGDLFNQSGKFSWWHKTIGTMDNLAKRHPAFARVYTSVQRFLGDVSRYAVVAADQAPTLLPKLENIRDILGKHRKQAVTAEDTQAIGAPILQGTLS